MERYANSMTQSTEPVRPAAGLEKVKEAYLPFYVTTASLRSELASAELGFQEWGTMFNPRTRRFERQLVVNWRPAVFDVVRRCATLGGLGRMVRKPWTYGFRVLWPTQDEVLT